ncbi:hypothetical protein NLJ89_g3075 [Agrocybe chaxingu]|uniref:G domain-containing protein n=1 Tax=Agrocybe chaxingu TaxID=84603 RepID=A0A9W8K5D9_9AGAR|nr:hypothetical protein NLJ89_g3075 [Agrocybe chaxingu]
MAVVGHRFDAQPFGKLRSASIPSLSQTLTSESSSSNVPADLPVSNETVALESGGPQTQSLSSFVLPGRDDIIIAVMGPTGAGKTTFISRAGGLDESELVGHELKSCTQEVRDFVCHDEVEARRVVLVDTPGFDDTNLSDLDILRKIADWLRKTYENDIKLSGLIYLHRISDNRMGGTPLRLLETFQKLCGTDVLRHVVLVTTMWDDVSEDVGNVRETELRRKYWKSMIDRGSRTCRFENTRESAWNVLSLFEDAPRQTLQLQRELVDKGMRLVDTAAARTLLQWLVEFIKTLKKSLARVRHHLKKASDSASRADLSRQERAFTAQIDMALTASRNYECSIVSNGTTAASCGSSSSDLTSAVDVDRFGNFMSPPPSPINLAQVKSRSSVLDSKLHWTITALSLMNSLVALSPVPGLQTLVGLLLTTTQLIEQSRSNDHALTSVVHRAASLMLTIIESNGCGDIKDTLRPHMETLRSDVTKLARLIKKSAMPKRLLLAKYEKQLIDECDKQISHMSDIFGIQIALINAAAIARIEAVITVMHKKPLDIPPRRVTVA